MSLESLATGVPPADSSFPRRYCSPVVNSVEASGHDIIATLGPAGTSSEAAAGYLANSLGIGEADAAFALYVSYEVARDALLAGRATRLLVANAYHGIHAFYFDPRLTLEQAFVFDTPAYGLAARRAAPVPVASRVVTHPAPQDLIGQLTPPGYLVATVDLAASTAAAAGSVAAGDADLAVTTAPAAELHDLHFISPTRRIRMLWSVFVRWSDQHYPATPS